ncbi:MAG: isoprenylcysteine carboxylmethyltransferase family protein [Candidatus Aenigmarchaeota archaeon]|nr:isoprenylcysteine carboxylmethyltransferase family protein [Candidatus Aenigmarchaeota archaeon]
MAVAVLCAAFFLPAGSLGYWQAWAYLGVVFIPGFFVIIYFVKRDPKLLERRMRFKEKIREQKIIITVSNIIFSIGFLIPGLDYRYHWSVVPVPLVIISDMMVLLGFMIVALVFRENSYASRIIQVEKDQKLITTGPYSIVRHPMYLGVLLAMLFTPLALGSYWGLVAFAPTAIIVALRTLNEEKVMMRKLPGYRAYARKVRYRIVPFVW